MTRTRKKDRFKIAARQNVITGRVQKHPRGFGFLIPDDRELPDIYLSKTQTLNIMDGDRLAVVRVSGRGGLVRAKIVEVIERRTPFIVGTFESVGSRTFVRQLGHDDTVSLRDRIHISPKTRGEAKDGNVVVAEITQYPQQEHGAEGKIVRVIGQKHDPAIDTEIIIAKYQLPGDFSSQATEQAMKASLQSIEKEIEQRVDLRSIPTVTIDGEFARDFDDAVSVKKLIDDHGQKFLRLWVSIADVSFYVPPNTPLDEEALERGNSVYFPDTVLPMLPEILSNDVCSLRPREDRLAMTCEIDFDPVGNAQRYDIYESVIRSDARLTYTQVQQFLDRGVTEAELGLLPEGGEMLLHLNRLHLLLRAHRLSRGSLDFDLPESEVIVDAQGKTEDIVKAVRYPAHMIIEECMIAANEAVARHLTEAKSPSLYRVHDAPDPGDLDGILRLAATLDFHYDLNLPIHDLLQQLLQQSRNTPYESAFNYSLLRSMKRAIYDIENIGHFGLASTHYCHFTSPIRRYPDLMIHRLLKRLKNLPSPVDSKKRRMEQERLSIIARHCSERERVADDAEREVVALKKAAFMKDKVGHTFAGTITGINSIGLVVQLDPLFVEGVVPLWTLPRDNWRPDNNYVLLRGQRTGKRWCLGQKVQVKVTRVDLDLREIDFQIESML